LVLLCVLLSCIMFTFFALALYDICVFLRYSCDMIVLHNFHTFFHVTCLVFCSYALLPRSSPISYELYYPVLISLVLSYEYIMLASDT
jgi:hypothetical protein